MKERRKAPRQKSFLRGNIQFNNGRNTADCLIRDISLYGARLTFSDTITTPDVIDIFIPQKEHTYRCHVVWRHGRELGVEFTQAAGASPVEHNLDPSGVTPSLTRDELAAHILAQAKRRAGGDGRVVDY